MKEEYKQNYGCIVWRDNFSVYGDADTKIVIGPSEFDKIFEDAVKEELTTVTLMRIGWNHPVEFYYNGRDRQGRIMYEQKQP